MFKNIIKLRKLRFQMISSSIFQLNTFKFNYYADQVKPTSQAFHNKFNSTSTITTPNIEEPNKTPASSLEEAVDADREKKLKILYLEVDVARQEGRRCPDPEFINAEQWKHLLSLKSRSARTKYYLYLWQAEKKKENQAIKKVQKTEALYERLAKEKLENAQNDHIIYGLNHTTMFLRIYDATINHWNNNKLVRAMQFGQKIVLDCSYDEYMNTRESVNTAKQLMLCFAENRAHDDPFDMHFCNADFQKTTMSFFAKHVPTLHDLHFPINVHEKCFTEIFPKEKIVYLTPHCRNDLLEYNPDDIYVIGGIVDKVNNEPLSLAKSKRLGLRMARLPLDKYLTWTAGSGKSLTLNQMVKIMLDIKHTGDWNLALKSVPKRKLVDYSQLGQGKYRNNREDHKIKVRAKKFNFDLSTWGSSEFSPTENSNKYTSYKPINSDENSGSKNRTNNPFKN